MNQVVEAIEHVAEQVRRRERRQANHERAEELAGDKTIHHRREARAKSHAAARLRS
jgi:hypothetical protein